MQSEEIFGTELRTSIEELNAEPELRRIGLSFNFRGGSIWIENGPNLSANLSNRIGVGEAISRHLASGGIQLKWPVTNGTYQWLRITHRGVEQVDEPS